MGTFKAFENMIEKKLMNMHTAYLGKVLLVDGNTAKIQPLGMTKAYGEKAQKQSSLSNVPIATKKITTEKISVISETSLNVEKEGDTVKNVSLNVKRSDITIAKETPIKAGDIVVCVCCERDISAAKKGVNTTPAIGHHSMSDSVIIGCL